MSDRRPPVGCQVNVVYINEAFASEKSRVVNYIGNYVVLENDLRFHVLDDAVGDSIWMLHDQSINISLIQ